ncbi:MAG TPA: DnaB-like helicase N-terminal domain-containing protein, partial [Chthoniobacterales bacterium]
MPSDSPALTAENPVKANGAPAAKNPSRAKGSSQKAGSYLPDIHRKLPQSLDAEKAVLSSILLSPNDVIDICAQRITAKHFYFPAHAQVYQIILDLWQASKPVDLITLTQDLSDRGMLDQVGGAAAISEIYTFVPTAANVDYYLDILTEKGLLREIITTCTEFAGRGYDELNDAKGFLDELEKDILKIGEERYRAELPTMKELVNEAIVGIEELYKN